ncbi:hypothetical protein ACFYXH_36200 [Streptomyces sp. NPDC002730]|uniref:hypothetical protein n=1 Tax=Streptomyces sp. NPDC002730 TaxID=3364662 RepID=UPI0036867E36
MAALQESVAKAKASRGEDAEADVHEPPEKRAAARTTAAKKATGRRPRSAWRVSRAGRELSGDGQVV